MIKKFLNMILGWDFEGIQIWFRSTATGVRKQVHLISTRHWWAYLKKVCVVTCWSQWCWTLLDRQADWLWNIFVTLQKVSQPCTTVISFTQVLSPPVFLFQKTTPPCLENLAESRLKQRDLPRQITAKSWLQMRCLTLWYIGHQNCYLHHRLRNWQQLETCGP